ncbi:FGGY family carbohydrate kinase [uncultured Metabacillus sp.]|uniref:FGGY-family carbohydrate kinase n=1 Tax=uncultured Metabacillus sp. TaxID=2860135 RepID=UPI00260EB4D5|nr:FGGY family carbohydrate kinase [uncultured Metabacillus sp.]
MALIGIDLGTTHCKAGLFHENGDVIQIAIRQMIILHDCEGNPFYHPEEIWNKIYECLSEIMSNRSVKVSVIGISSMAETGLLLDRETGRAKTAFIPWFSRCALNEANQIGKEDDPFRRFQKTGLHTSYKYGLAKILSLKGKDKGILKHAVWLSASDFIAYKLTGKLATDYTLAARTYAFRIDQKDWDLEWINHFELPKQLFPQALPSGTIMGETTMSDLQRIGIGKGTPVAIAGHDHVCASLAVGAVKPGIVFDSIGTAETLVGTLEKRDLSKNDYESRLSFGCHIVANRFFWMGGISSSGGSIEWFRDQLSDQTLSYEEIIRLSLLAKEGPTGILYYPYLSGSGAPNHDPDAKAAFIGVAASHERQDLLKAIMEGTCYEMEAIRRSAERITEHPINHVIVVGGGAKNKAWLKIKADITNCQLTIPSLSEATLLGAAMTAGIGSKVYQNVEEAISSLRNQKKRITPNEKAHRDYRKIYEIGYMKLQHPLRDYYHSMTEFVTK